MSTSFDVQLLRSSPLERRSTASAASEVMTSATNDLPQCSYRSEGNAVDAKNPKEDRCQNEEKMISRRRERSALFGKAPAHEVPRKSPCRGGDKQSRSCQLHSTAMCMTECRHGCTSGCTAGCATPEAAKAVSLQRWRD